MSSPWHTVRVFISSTFRDMQAERDQLVKVVFPELRELLKPYRIRLIDIDLRWGVTKEQAENDQVLDLCLQQIDQCRPYFIGILGERYGWVPTQYPVTAQKKYGWLQYYTGKSVTELEILHGVLDNPAMQQQAFFYFRDPAALDAIAEPLRSSTYRETDPELVAKLAILKQRIRASGLPVFENYPATWEADLPDRSRHEQSRFVGLEVFGQHVCQQLLHAITTHLQLDRPLLPHSIWDEETAAQEQFLETRQHVYIGRESLLDSLDQFALQANPTQCLVSGPAGSGKSALLARWVTRFRQRHPETLVIPHFVGGSPRSTTLRPIILRVADLMRRELKINYWVSPEATNVADELRACFRQIPSTQRCVLVIDALNQLDEEARMHVGWLPSNTLPNIRVIVSCLEVEGPEGATYRLLAASSGVQILHVPLLADGERRDILRDVPAIAAKVLEPDQIDLLLANPATANPLFLLTVLEELRGFGSYEDLTDRIRSLPRTNDAVVLLFEQILARLEQDFSPTIVHLVCTALAAARRGLAENELRALALGLSGASDLFPVLRQLRPFLSPKGAQLDFFHQALRQAIERRYWPTTAERHQSHARLADLFSHQDNRLALQENEFWRERGLARPAQPILHRPPNIRKFDEWPWQALHAKRWDEVASAFTNREYLEANIQSGRSDELLSDFEQSLGQLPTDHPSRQVLEPLAKALLRNIAILRGNGSIQALWSLCWWHDCPAAATVYDLGPYSAQAPWQQPGPKLYQLIEDWCGTPLSPTTDGYQRPPKHHLGGPLRQVLRGNGGGIEDLAVSPDDQRLAVPYCDVDGSDTVVIYRLPGGRHLQSLSVPESISRKASFSHVFWCSDGERIAAYAKGYSSAYLWNAFTGELLAPLSFYDDENVGISTAVPKDWRHLTSQETLPDGRHANRYQDGSRRIINRTQRMAMLPDGRVLLLGTDHSLRLWDCARGADVKMIRLPGKYPSEMMHVRADGRAVAVVLNDAHALLFDLESWREYSMTPFKEKVCVVALSADGQWLTTGAESGVVKVWRIPNTPDFEPLKMPAVTFTGHTRTVRALALTHDGRLLASGGNDHTIRVWDVATGTMLTLLDGHTDFVVKLTLTSDERTLISTGRDGHVCLWDLSPQSLALQIRDANEPMTQHDQCV